MYDYGSNIAVSENMFQSGDDKKNVGTMYELAPEGGGGGGGKEPVSAGPAPALPEGHDAAELDTDLEKPEHSSLFDHGDDVESGSGSVGGIHIDFLHM